MRITEYTLDFFQRAETSEPVRVDETLLLRRDSHPRMIAKLTTCRIPRNLATTWTAGLSDTRFHPHEFLKTPILKSLGLPCTIYVATSRILRGGRYWYDDVICALLASNRARLRLDTSLGPLEYKASGRTESARWTAVEGVLAALKSLPKGERRSLVDTLQAEALVPELRMMTPDELKTLSSDPLTTIGNHTHGHDLLDRVSLVQGEISIIEAQGHLEEWTSIRPRHFSYPNGNFTDDVAQQVASLGFQSAVTTESRQWAIGDSVFHIPRIGIGRFDSMNLFRARISGLVY